MKFMDDKGRSEDQEQLRVDRRKMMKMMGTMSLGAISIATPLSVTTQGTEVDVRIFHTLQDAKENNKISDGATIQTLGYYNLNDGGGAVYHVSKSYIGLEANGGDVIAFKNGLKGVLLEQTHTNYKMFGAVGDGKNDDGVQIKMAHEYANKHKIPVVNYLGEYWIEETRNIYIQSAVYWGESIFHINESLNTKQAVFRVSSRYESEDIHVDAETKSKIIEAIRPGLQELPELKKYKNHLIAIVDDNDRIGFRAGARFKGQSWAREELFYIEEDGRVIGDIAWGFKDYTLLRAYPAEQSYLIIEGGTFYLSGDSHPEPERKGYFQNGFSITRSRTIIRNQWVGLEEGKSDISFNPRNGFYNFNSVYDVSLENIRLVPWEQDRPGEERDLYAGTYGISARRMMRSTFRNITAEGTMLHWGVFATNLNKDFRIEKCQLNRVDTHFHCWNLTIQDSQIGNRGIAITGGGNLIIENTTCSNLYFVNFRYDYGAKWDGPIYINNCQLKPNRTGETCVLRFYAGNSDYRYQIGLGEKIYINNFTVDFSSIPDNQSECWLIKSSNFSKTQYGERLFFPRSIICENITVKGRDKGVRLIKIVDPQNYMVAEKGGDNGSFVKYNALIKFNNIQLEDITESEKDDFHLQVTEENEGDYDVHSLYPHFSFSRCHGLSLDLGNAISETVGEHTTISRINTGTVKKRLGEMNFSYCRFLPQLSERTHAPYLVGNGQEISFTNCVFYSPVLNGEIRPDLFHLIDWIKINDSVRFNHVNSRLGRDVLHYLDTQSITLKKEFVSKLQSNYESQFLF